MQSQLTRIFLTKQSHLFEDSLISLFEPAGSNYDIKPEAVVVATSLLQGALEPRIQRTFIVKPPSEKRPYTLNVSIEVAALQQRSKLWLETQGKARTLTTQRSDVTC